jgi:two-component system nitrate/nitrite sensor histidine kinase NarX
MNSAVPSSCFPAGADLLGELASDLANDGNLPELLARFLEPLLQMSGADAGAVRAITDRGDQLQLIASVGLSDPSPAEAWADRDCGACGAAASAGVEMWTSSLQSCARLKGTLRGSAEFRRMVAVPLRHRGRVLGVYNLFFSNAAGLRAEAAPVLKSVGELLGLALNNARLERAHLRATVMHEREMMAAEVHDAIAQTLTFIKMRLPLLEEAVRSHADAAAQRYLHDLRSATGEAHASLRSIIHEFRTPPDPLGLGHALQDRVRQLKERHGIDAELVNHSPGLTLPPAEEAQVVHIVSEALANVARHARAAHAWLSLAVHGGEVELKVEDDGAGFGTGAPSAGEGHHGIEIMRERARRIGGRLELRSRQGGLGTLVKLNFPLPRPLGA